MERIASFVTGRPRTTVALLVIVTLVSLVGMTRLTFDDVPREIFRTDSEDFRRLEQVYEQFGSDDNEVIVVLDAQEGFFRPEAASALRELSSSVLAIEGIAWVYGLAETWSFTDGIVPRPLLPSSSADEETFRTARERAREHPLVGGRLLSDDGTAALLFVRLAGNSLGVADVKPRVLALQETFAAWTKRTGMRARMTGVPSVRVEIYDTVQREIGIFLGAGALACILVATLIFRRVGTVLVAAFGPVLGSFWTLGAMGLSGSPIDLMSTALPTLVIAIGFTDAIHLVVDLRRSRAAGESRMQAARSAILHLGLPCALTSITTAIGFGSLVVGDVEIIRRFSLAAAGGVLLTFASVITTVPLGSVLLADLGGAKGQAREARLGRALGGMASWIAERPRSVSVAGILVTLALLAVSLRLEADNRLTEATPRGNESYLALRDIERSFGGVLPVYVLVEWEDELELSSPRVVEAIEGAVAIVEGDPLTTPSTSILNVADLLPSTSDDRGRQLASAAAAMPADVARRLVRPDLSRALISSAIADLPSWEANAMTERVSAQLAELDTSLEGVRIDFTGTNVVGRRNINAIITSLAQGLVVAALAIFVVMALEFRSLRIALISLLPNVFPLVFVGALMVAVGIPLKIATALVFTVLLGLAVDDTIHVLARYRRELSSGFDTRVAVERSVILVGRALMVTTSVLVAGFAPSLTSDMPTSVIFTAFVMVGLVAAVIGDLVFLPALLLWAFGSRKAG